MVNPILISRSISVFLHGPCGRLVTHRSLEPRLDFQPARRPAFTLIEVLVVITLIVVLASMSLAGITAVIHRAKKACALDVCTAVVRATDAYFDEFGSLPPGTGDLTTAGGDGARFIQALAGESTEDNPDAQSPKRIRFFQTREAKGKKDGIEWAGDTVTALWDPWGFPYHLRLDAGYEQKIDDPLVPGHTVRNARILVHTHGKNNKPDHGKGDDVKSW